MPPCPPPPPSVQVHHHPIPDRLAPYIDRATTRDLVSAIGLRWQLVPTGCVGFTVVVGDPANGFDLQTTTIESWMTRMLTRAWGTWCPRSCIIIAVTLTPLAMAQLPMEALDLGFALSLPASEVFGRALIARLHGAVRGAPTIDAKMQALLQVQQMAQLVWQGHSLANAAATLGFADQAHMTRLVHEVTGMPPAMLLQRARASPFARTTGMPRVLRLAEV